MKAIVQARYGRPSSVRSADVPEPTAGPGQVLVRVHASSVNAADVEILAGYALVRIAAPFRPANRIVGSDVAGVVERVGPGVTELTPGDEVMGDLSMDGFGAFAELVAAGVDAFTAKPAGLTFDEAAAVPSAAWVAVKGIRARPLESGSHVLVNGAGGGMGTFAIQMAKARGAHVTAVDRGFKHELLRSIGADEVVDFESADPTAIDRRFDLILDVTAHRSVRDWHRVLAPAGAYLIVGGPSRRIIEGALLGRLLSRHGEQRLGLLVGWPHSERDKTEVSELITSGLVRPVIDRAYPLAEAAAALQHVADGRALGKVVIRVRDA
jgi:NADPH:quinone reductase-like Zn-dependent oxidoreductase